MSAYCPDTALFLLCALPIFLIATRWIDRRLHRGAERHRCDHCSGPRENVRRRLCASCAELFAG